MLLPRPTGLLGAGLQALQPHQGQHLHQSRGGRSVALVRVLTVGFLVGGLLYFQRLSVKALWQVRLRICPSVMPGSAAAPFNRQPAPSGLANIGEKQALQQQLTVLSTGVAKAYRRSIKTRNRASMLARQGNLDSTAEILNSPLLEHLKERYVELRSGAGTSNGPTGATNVTIEQLREGIAAETQHFVAAAQNDADIVQKLEASMRAELTCISTALVDWQNKERTRDELHRPMQTDLNARAAANERYIQEAVRGDALQADIEITASAVAPDRPAFPNVLLYSVGTVALLVLLDGLVLLPLILRRVQADRINRAL